MTFSMVTVVAALGLALSSSSTSKPDPNAGKLACEEGGQYVYKDRKDLAKCKLGNDTVFQLGTIQSVMCARGSVAKFFPGGQLASCKLAVRAKLQHRNGQGQVGTLHCEPGPASFTVEGFVGAPGSAGCELSKIAW